MVSRCRATASEPEPWKAGGFFPGRDVSAEPQEISFCVAVRHHEASQGYEDGVVGGGRLSNIWCTRSNGAVTTGEMDTVVSWCEQEVEMELRMPCNLHDSYTHLRLRVLISKEL